MNKVFVAFSSFLVGACCAAALLVSANTFAGQGTAISMPSAVPQVPPLQFFGDGSNIAASTQQLDGLQCNRCIITVPLLSYQGGAVNLSNCKLSPKVSLQLKGAALNTFIVLRSLGYISSQAPKALSEPLEIKSTDVITLHAMEGIK